MSQKTYFYLPVGDFSLDGHEKVEEFLCSADKSLDAIREAHFRLLGTTGVDMSAFCSDCGDNTVTGDTYLRLLQLKLDRYLSEDTEGIHRVKSPDDMARIWVALLNRSDPELNMRIIDTDGIPRLLFTGLDEKGRACRSVGYGLYSADGDCCSAVGQMHRCNKDWSEKLATAAANTLLQFHFATGDSSCPYYTVPAIVHRVVDFNEAHAIEQALAEVNDENAEKGWDCEYEEITERVCNTMFDSFEWLKNTFTASRIINIYA